MLDHLSGVHITKAITKMSKVTNQFLFTKKLSQLRFAINSKFGFVLDIAIDIQIYLPLCYSRPFLFDMRKFIRRVHSSLVVDAKVWHHLNHRWKSINKVQAELGHGLRLDFGQHSDIGCFVLIDNLMINDWRCSTEED